MQSLAGMNDAFGLKSRGGRQARAACGRKKGLVACANSASLPVKVKTARSRDCKRTVSVVVAFNNSAPLPHWWHLHEWQHSCGTHTHTHSPTTNRPIAGPVCSHHPGPLPGRNYRLLVKITGCCSNSSQQPFVTCCVIHFKSSLIISGGLYAADNR